MMNDKEIKFTLKLCKKADDAYYNPTKKNSRYLLTDKEYDTFKEELEDNYKTIKDENLKAKVKKYLKSVGSKVRTSKRDTILPFMIGSLAKVTKDKLSKMKSMMKMLQTPDYVCGPKIDGTSVTLKYVASNKKNIFSLENAFSRGDGKVGQSKLGHLSRVKGIPLELNDSDMYKGYQEVFVRGELVIFTEDFEKVKGEKYKESRNSCTGWLNADEPDSKLTRLVRFIPYELLDSKGEPVETAEIKSKVYALKFLNTVFKDQYDFKIFNKAFGSNDVTKFIPVLEHGLIEKEKLPYVTDGLVFEVNNYAIRKELNKGNTSKYPKFAVAYKQSADDAVKTEGVETKVTEITRTVNKAGLNSPTINYKPIKIGNSNFTKANGVHYAHICTKGFEKGTKIAVVKAGGVIPKAYLLDKPKKIKPPKECLCGAKAVIVEGKEPNKWNLYCSKPTKCAYAQQDNLFQTLKGLKLTGLGVVNIQKLFDAGYKDIFELLDAKEKKLLKIEGFGESIITTIKIGVPQKLKELSEAKLMECSGVFIRPGLSLAEKTLQEIIDGKTTKGERYDLFQEKKKAFKEWKKKLKTYL